ncbi:MAG: hypothetical protein QNK05_02610 [Myxococcota bacterium]|nr:hypothetical protein [Myxococcota bacterium]
MTMRILNVAVMAAILLLSTAAWAAQATTGVAETQSTLLMGAGLAGLVIAGNPRASEQG